MFIKPSFVLIVTIAVIAICVPRSSAAKNVLLIVSDNQNKTDCGCYGNKQLKTPNLDRLAKDGVRFLDAFATTASCGPSRAVIYSGMQTHSNGQYGHGHGIHTYGLAPKIQTVFQLLKDSGYETALLGKQHVVPLSAYPFSYSEKVSGRDILKIAAKSREFIEQAGDTPFLLTIGYSDPHPTSRARPGWGVVRPADSVPLINYDQSKLTIPSYLPDRPEVREGLAGYYQQISYMDHGIGQVLDVLRETGKEKDTLVIFTSDHGSSEPGAMSNHYEPGIQVPFIVRHPDGTGAGTTNTGLVSLADITPTILDWMNVKGPKYPMQGRSFLPILGEPEPKGWDQVMLTHVCHEVTMYYPMRTIRNRRYKLIWNPNWRAEYPLPIDTLQRATWTETIRLGETMIGKRSVKNFLFRPVVELYDLQSDPDEINNVADDPKHAEIRRQLSAELLAWLETTKDPWLVRHRLPLHAAESTEDSRQSRLD